MAAATESVTPHELPKSISGRRRTGLYRLAGQIPIHIAGQPVRPLVTRVRSFSIAFITIQSNSPRTAAEDCFGSVCGAWPRSRAAPHRAQTHTRLRRLFLADDPLHLRHNAAERKPLPSNGVVPVSSSYSSTPSE